MASLALSLYIYKQEVDSNRLTKRTENRTLCAVSLGCHVIWMESSVFQYCFSLHLKAVTFQKGGARDELETAEEKLLWLQIKNYEWSLESMGSVELIYRLSFLPTD